MKTYCSRCISTIAVVLALVSVPVQAFAGQRAAAGSLSNLQPRHAQTTPSAPPAVALPMARGEEAVRVLKQEKLYDSLAGGVSGRPLPCRS
jgi:hypothetical protein